MEPILKYKSLLINLVEKDIKVVYMGTVMGFAWSFLNPLVFIATYFIVFQHLFHMENFGLYIVTGILHWGLFARVIGNSADLLQTNASLLKKIYFPRILLPIASVATAHIFWFSTMIVFFIIYPFFGGVFHMGMLYYPLVLLAYAMFLLGLNMIICITQTYYRDIKHLVEVALQVLFWLTPIIYSPALMPEKIRILFNINPLYSFLSVFQTIFHNHTSPSLMDMVVACSLGFGTFLLGYTIFKHNTDTIIDRL